MSSPPDPTIIGSPTPSQSSTASNTPNNTLENNRNSSPFNKHVREERKTTERTEQQNNGTQQPKGPFCILTPCSNSHPFDERKIPVTRTEENAVKIGRSVVRLQPSPNNAIFDCKVLSRNHAVLWLDNEDRFLIKDTRSSNGTFINNERLSASGEESDARELFSGDILQLGVEIVDNTKKVASGCITCIVRLINERGEECAGRPQSDHFSFPLQQQQIPLNYTLVRNDKLFILDQYVKEAKYRENLLGQKLQTLEEQLVIAQEALQTKWEEHINQELLLSRIELLESQLTFFTTKKSSIDEDKIRQELQELMEDRAKTEQLAKDTLRTKQEQMQETSMKLHDAEMSLVNVEGECEFLRQRCADYDEQMNRNREDYESLLAKYNEVCMQLCAAEKAAISAQTSSQNQQMNGGEFVGNKIEHQNLEMQNPKSDKTEEVQQDADSIKWITVPPTNVEPTEDQQKESIKLPEAIHHCQEDELRQRCKAYEAELKHQTEQYTALVAKYNAEIVRRDEVKGTNKDEVKKRIVQGSSSTDFQVFLLCAFPFLLVILMLLSPVCYFLGCSWLIVKPTKTTTDSSATDKEENST